MCVCVCVCVCVRACVRVCVNAGKTVELLIKRINSRNHTGGIAQADGTPYRHFKYHGIPFTPVYRASLRGGGVGVAFNRPRTSSILK
jgi:hypothetical protein